MTSPQAQELPQFWHVTYSMESSYGGSNSFGDVGHNEQHARILAIMHSRMHGSATITNREGYVASYVNGVENKPQLKLKPVCQLPACGCTGEAHP